MAITRFDLSGSLVSSVRLGYVAPSILPITQSAAAAQSGDDREPASSVPVAGTPAVSARAAGGWLVRWARLIGSVPAPGDGVTVQLADSGSFHAIVRTEHPTRRRSGQHDRRGPGPGPRGRAAGRLVHGEGASGEATIASVARAWVAPNDTFGDPLPAGPAGALRLAWVVRVTTSGALADRAGRARAGVRCRQRAAARRRRPRVIRRLVSIIGAVALVATCLAACAAVPTGEPSPTARPSPDASPVASAPAPATTRAWWPWSGRSGAMALVAAGRRRGASRPVGGVGSYRPMRPGCRATARRFVVTTLDGRILVGGLTDLAPAPGDLGRAASVAGVRDPRSGSAAAGTAAAARLRRRRPGFGRPRAAHRGERSTAARLARSPLPRPAESAPAWLPDGRIAVVGRDRADRPETLLVDPRPGGSRRWMPPPLRSIGTAAGVVATIDVDGIAARRTRCGVARRSDAAVRCPSIRPSGPALMAEPSPRRPGAGHRPRRCQRRRGIDPDRRARRSPGMRSPGSSSLVGRTGRS